MLPGIVSHDSWLAFQFLIDHISARSTRVIDSNSAHSGHLRLTCGCGATAISKHRVMPNTTVLMPLSIDP